MKNIRNALNSKNKINLLIVSLILSFSCFSQTKIIFDTDFGGDADDLGALAMLHELMKNGECELIAIACWQTEKYAIPAIDAINYFYKHDQIPIGVRKEVSYVDSTNYSRAIAESFYHKLNMDTALDATILYRSILSKSEDKSITIVCVGPLKNIENLINSKADTISLLSGKELINTKVKEFVIMGGNFPKGEKEWNFDGGMKGVTKFVVNNISVPITFSGFELGVDIKTGESLNYFNKITPLYVGYKYFSENAPWKRKFYMGSILDNSSYDQTAVLYAVRNGIGHYWDKINGLCIPDNNGGNKWLENKNFNHSYLKLKMNNKIMGTLIESIMTGNF